MNQPLLPPRGGADGIALLRLAAERLRNPEAAASRVDYPELDVRALVDQVRARIEAERLGHAESDWPAVEGPRAEFPRASFPRPPHAWEPIEIRGRYTLEELVEPEGESFVRNAYRALLHREPDPMGSNTFQQHLRFHDTTKVELLAGLRRSKEGREVGTRVVGLRLAYAAQRLRRIPVLGSLLSTLWYLLRLPESIARIERTERLIHRREDDLRQALDLLAAAAEEHANAMAEQTRSALWQSGEALRRLDREKSPRTHGTVVAEQVAALRAELLRIATELSQRATQDAVVELSDAALAASTEMQIAVRRLQETKAEAARVESVERETAQFSAAVASHASRLQDVDQKLAAKASAADVAARHEELIAWQRAGAEEAAQRIDGVHAEISRHAQRFDRIDFIVTTKADQQWVAENLGRIDSKADQQWVAENLGRIDSQVSSKADESLVSERLSSLLSRTHLEEVLAEGDLPLDQYYVDFENAFRGPRAEIKQRVAVYLPILQGAGAGSAEAPVLDIGCGRGELLELLKDNGMLGRGLDLNPRMVEMCRGAGLEVAEVEGLAYLRSLPEGSLGAVTGIHVIEHLPFPQRMALFQETLRVLRPGGVAIFETPNPENLIVGACNFWYDPTHVAPLPPAGTRFAVHSHGYERADILRLHPYAEEARVRDGAKGVRETLNNLMFNHQDYAIVAYKANAPPS